MNGNCFSVKIIVFLSFFCKSLITAQSFSIEPTLHFGTIIKHTKKIKIQTGQLVVGQEINLRFQTLGKEDWQVLQRFPVFGMSLAHFNFGDGAHGEGIGLTPNLSVQVFQKGNFRAMFRLGSGIGRVSRPFHFLKNPKQNAIGSHWNGTAQFNFSTEFRFSQNFRAVAGAGFYHFSNGGRAFPNFGLNIPSGYFSLAWSPRGQPDFEKREVSRRPDRRFAGLIYGGAVWVEYLVEDGPRYPIWMGTAAAAFYLNKVNRVLLGIDYEYNKAVFKWGLHSATFDSKKTAKLASTRLAVLIGDEFLFGDFSVQLQSGIYIGDRLNQYVLNTFYNKLIMRYYLPRLPFTKIRPHVGVYLKAHNVIAEYLAINAGLSF